MLSTLAGGSSTDQNNNGGSMLATRRFFYGALFLLGAAGCASQQPVQLTGAQCQSPPPQRCPDADCPGQLVIATGEVVDEKTGRKFFLDYPCDLKKGEDVTFVLNLHGGGSYGNWQRHYFPIVDFKDKYRLVIATPNSPVRFWTNKDDEHLQNIVSKVYEDIGAENIKAFWFAGHSQGGATSHRLVCTDYFAPKVTGLLSLSGGRVGPAARPTGVFRPSNAAERAAGAGEAAPAPTPPPGTNMPTSQTPRPLPTCDFSHIFTTGEHELGAPIPETSPWAQKYECGARVRRADVSDDKAGYVYDSGRQDPATKAWGRPPRGGVAQVYEFPDCKDGKVVADVVRMDKGHTEGLEPNVTEALIKLMMNAR